MNPRAQYQLVKKLATGGMAEVYLAKAEGPMGFEKKVVVKRILPHLAEDARFVRMFLGEARLAAMLDHPNVVHVFDFGQAGDRYFLAMEHIDGLDLRTLLLRAHTKGDWLSPVLCARIVSLAAEGLAYAHDFRHPETGQNVGIVHRDVSPDNLLIARSGVVKVVDFGIAKVAGDPQTRTGRLKGKLAYMAPEQVRGAPLDRRVDVYALGAVLYQLLTFARPFEQDHEALLMQAIVHESHVPIAKRRPDLPKELCRIVEKALSKQPEQRYASAREMHDALESFVMDSGQPASAYYLAQLVEEFKDSPCVEGPTRLDRRPRGKYEDGSEPPEILIAGTPIPDVPIPVDEIPEPGAAAVTPPSHSRGWETLRSVRVKSRRSRNAVLALAFILILAGAVVWSVESSWMRRWLTGNTSTDVTPVKSATFPVQTTGQAQ